MTTSVLNTKISEVEYQNRISNMSGLVTTFVLSPKICEDENKNPNLEKYITTPSKLKG